MTPAGAGVSLGGEIGRYRRVYEGRRGVSYGFHRVMDFGLYSLCGLLLMSAPLQGEKICTWKVLEGDLGAAENWSPELTPELSLRQRWEIQNGGTAVVAAGRTYGLGLDLLIASAGGSGTLRLDGNASLTIKRYLSIGQAGTGQGEVLVNDSATLVIENGTLLVGQRSNGILKVAKGASVVVQSGNIRVAEGLNGTIDLFGSLETPDLVFGARDDAASSQTGELLCHAGSSLRVGKRMTFATMGSHLVQLQGSGGTFSVGSLTANSSVTFRFVADKAGVTPMEVTGSLEISGASLEVSLDHLGSMPKKLLLFKGSSPGGEFGRVTLLGNCKGTVKYEKSGIYFVP